MTSAQELLLFYPGFFGTIVLLICCAGYYTVVGQNQRIDRFLAAVILAPILNFVGLSLVNKLSAWWPEKFDLYVYQVDRLFGEPSFRLAALFEPHPRIRIAVMLIYGLLGMAALVLFGCFVWFREHEVFEVIRIFVLNLALALPIFLILPSCGPIYAFPNFPALPGPVTPHLMNIDAPPNGIPSVHFSTALLLFYLSRRFRYGVWFGGAAVVLTLVAILATGEHYLIDGIAAVPYSMVVYRLGVKARAKYEKPELVEVG